MAIAGAGANGSGRALLTAVRAEAGGSPPPLERGAGCATTGDRNRQPGMPRAMASSSPRIRRGLAPDLEARLGRIVEPVARGLAYAGGVVLAALTVMSVISITGRGLAGLVNPLGLVRIGPIPGDFELVEAGTAFAVFAFLPWCQLNRGHVTVDVFVARAGARTRAWLSLAGNLLLTMVAAVIAWRLVLGLIDKRAYGETTFILQLPVWWGYLAAAVGAAVFALVSAYTAWRSLNEALGPGEPA